MSTSPQPWERQPGESPQAFQAFALYRDMGAARSYSKVAAQLGKSETLIGRWGRTNRWQARSAEWDREEDRQFLADQRAARKQAARRQAALATTFQAKAVSALSKVQPGELSPADIIRWLDVSTRIEREAVAITLDDSAVLALVAAGLPLFGHRSVDLPDEERRARMAELRRELDSRLQQGAGDVDPGAQGV